MRRAIILLAKCAISLAALWLAFRLGSGAMGFADLPRPDLRWLLGTVALQVAMVAGLALRWWLLSRTITPARGGMSLWSMTRITWGGLGMAQIALGPVSSDAVRVAGLKLSGLTIGAATRNVLLDRILGLACLVAVGVCASALLLPARGLAALALGLAGFGAVLVAALVVLGRAWNAARAFATAPTTSATATPADVAAIPGTGTGGGPLFYLVALLAGFLVLLLWARKGAASGRDWRTGA